MTDNKTGSRLTGGEVRSLMRRHGKTIRGLSLAMKITQARVREVRARGVTGEAFVRDWLEAVGGSEAREALAHRYEGKFGLRQKRA